MPFDIRSYTAASLTDAVAFLGIQPIADEVLQVHKAQEVRRHPGSWWFRHRYLGTMLIGLGLVGSMVGTFMGLIATMVSLTATGRPCVASVLLVVCGAIFVGIIKSGALSVRGLVVKGPAHWEEFYGYCSNIPSEIEALARRITALVPRSYVMIGELRQDTTSLDPYLVVRRDLADGSFDQVVVGIWDDTRVIRIAE